MSIILATWEARMGGLWYETNSGKQFMRPPISKTIRAKWSGGVAQALEGLLCNCEALSSNPIPTNPPHHYNGKIYWFKFQATYKFCLNVMFKIMIKMWQCCSWQLLMMLSYYKNYTHLYIILSISLRCHGDSFMDSRISRNLRRNTDGRVCAFCCPSLVTWIHLVFELLS
jgi:hypothetical protein